MTWLNNALQTSWTLFLIVLLCAGILFLMYICETIISAKLQEWKARKTLKKTISNTIDAYKKRLIDECDKSFGSSNKKNK